MNEILSKMLQFFGLSSLFGWVILFAGIGSRREQRRREETEHTRAAGRIVEYAAREKIGKNGKYTVYTPVIEFMADGRRVRGEYESGMKRDEHPVGEEVEVFYDVSRPERFHLESDPAFSRGAGNLMKLGLIWIVLAAALTLALAVLVGGLRLDFGDIFWRIRRAVAAANRR